MDIESYKVPSKRTKQRRIKQAKDRQLLSLRRELTVIEKQIKDLGYEDLHPPIQRGWKRYFVLRPDVALGVHAAFYQQILDKINQVCICHKRDFKQKKRKMGKNNYVAINQEPKYLNETEFAKVRLSEAQKALFARVRKQNQWSGWFYCYEFMENWRFVLKTERNMITQKRVRDWDLEKRKNEIEHILYDASMCYYRFGWLSNSHISGARWYWADPIYEKQENPLRNRSLHQIVNAIYQDQLAGNTPINNLEIQK